MLAAVQAYGQQDQRPEQQTKEKSDKTKNEVVVKNNKNQGMGTRDTLNNKEVNTTEKTSVRSNTGKQHDADKKKKTTTRKVKKENK